MAGEETITKWITGHTKLLAKAALVVALFLLGLLLIADEADSQSTNGGADLSADPFALPWSQTKLATADQTLAQSAREQKYREERYAADLLVEQYKRERYALDVAEEEAEWIAAQNSQQSYSTPDFYSSAAPSPSGGGGKAYIYSHESGNDPNAVNPSSGACGLCQALPCSKMGCALGDYSCQDAWCETYMAGRYGTWDAAMYFHMANNWW